MYLCSHILVSVRVHMCSYISSLRVYLCSHILVSVRVQQADILAARRGVPSGRPGSPDSSKTEQQAAGIGRMGAEAVKECEVSRVCVGIIRGRQNGC